MRYFIHLSYKGNNYKGWQRQINSQPSIQETIESAIFATTNEKIALIGCGRTDAGVHASQFFAHCDVEIRNFGEKLENLNFALPQDIVVHDIFEMNSNSNARFDAVERHYEYYMHFTKNAFLDDISAYYHYEKLDIESIKMACEFVKTQTEFKNFCKTPEKQNTTICHISDCGIFFNEDHSKARFFIVANRFLKAMVRILVFEILEVGRANKSLQEFYTLFKTRNSQIDKIAHPQGLYLSKIRYDYLDVPSKNNIVNLLEF